MGRPKGTTNEDILDRWYDQFALWGKESREMALRTLERNHRAICIADTVRAQKRATADAPPKSGELELANEADMAEAGKVEKPKPKMSLEEMAMEYGI